MELLLLKEYILDFPGGPVVKNPPANAGDMNLIPGPGRSHMLRPHALQWLGPCATTTEARALQQKSLQQKALAPQLRSSPH